MDYKKTAREIVEKVGGDSNIVSIMACFTRVRFEVVDKSKVDEAALKKVEGVQGLAWTANTVQVIVGSHCNDVYDEIEKNVHLSENKDRASVEVKKQNIGARIIDYIGNTIQPVIPVLVVSGLVQSILAMFNYLNLDTTTYTYQVINAIGQAGYYFLPVFLAMAAAKKLHINEFVGAMVGAILIYPSLVTYGSAGGTQTFLGIPVTMVSYASSITPIILTMPLVAVIYNAIKKVCPKIISSMIVPLVTVVVSIPLALIITGPIATWISNGLYYGVNYIFENLSVLGGVIIGAIAPYLVLTGVHNGIALPITLTELSTQGFSYFFPLLAYGNIAVGGAALGVYLRTKNQNLKTTSLSGSLMAIVGITEPALFGALLPTKKPLISLGIMDAICSAISLVLGVKCTALAMCGLGGLPAFFGDTFVYWCILMVVSFVGATLITYFLGFEDVEE
ncbi:MAG: PTS transporter subunit EIIC [Traorella sp.]